MTKVTAAVALKNCVAFIRLWTLFYCKTGLQWCEKQSYFANNNDRILEETEVDKTTKKESVAHNMHYKKN